MRVIAKKTLIDFWIKHSGSEQALKSWYDEVKKVEWTGPSAIKQDFPSASLLRNNRVVFNIKGNTYRLIVKINYGYGIVWIRFIGTHAEYDKTDADTI